MQKHVHGLLGLALCLGTGACTAQDGANGQNGANGNDGVSTLSVTTIEPAGANCEFGGVKIQFGGDTNRNGVLEESEIQSTAYACDGAPGTDGSDGADGSDGNDGTDGEDGADGRTSLVSIVSEPPGEACAFGGTAVSHGIDQNDNNTLEEVEIMGTEYICNGGPGENGANGLNSLIAVNDEPEGANCVNGGKRIDSGVDDNGNNTLEQTEIDATSYLCTFYQCVPGMCGGNGTCDDTDGVLSCSCDAGYAACDLDCIAATLTSSGAASTQTTTASFSPALFGQSFTALASGRFAELSVSIQDQLGQNNVTVSLFEGDVCGVQPCSTVPVVEQTFPFVNGTNVFAFSSSYALITGQVYTWKLFSGGQIDAVIDSGNGYAGGRSLAVGSFDHVFSTQVEVAICPQ